ncbi:helix-turn-helix domain-containing protein [Streptomyces sp. NPDC096191]|uniref:helix-turn-helix domain-containing protein n=1 Tax=Streptomyces sp. NPDC096191 TaxID=3155426 RepID=UPI0033288C3F
MLDVLGLDETCAAVYKALLEQPQAGIEELRRSLRLDEDGLRTSLDRLSELALVRPRQGEPDVYRAVDPQLGVQAVIAHQQEQLAAEQQRVEQLRLAAVHLAADFAAIRPRRGLPDVEQLDDIDEIRDRIHILVREVRDEVMTLVSGGAQSAASMEAARSQDEELLRRGVRMRTVYLDSVRNSPETVEYATWLGELGGEIRTVPALPLRLMIMDRDVAIVPVDGADSKAGALLLAAHGPVTAMCALFDRFWEEATPLGHSPDRDRGRDACGPTRQEAEVLRMLSQGLTDETVAKHLGVSARTARRIAAELMDELGARSRFQAGARAVAKGWLSGEE